MSKARLKVSFLAAAAAALASHEASLLPRNLELPAGVELKLVGGWPIAQVTTHDGEIHAVSSRGEYLRWNQGTWESIHSWSYSDEVRDCIMDGDKIVGVGRGKKQFEKRESVKEAEAKREIDRALRRK